MLYDFLLKTFVLPYSFNQVLATDFLLKQINNDNKNFGISWVNMAQSSCPISVILEFIKNNAITLPVRTGHVGNWKEILNARSGACDHNYVVCKNKYGAAYITEFNQTENKALTSGDGVYMPMSFIWKGRREFIQGYFYDENKWNKCLEDKSYFTPFVKIEYQGKQMPLCDFHKKNALGISWFSEEMLKYSRMIKKALNDIFTNYKKYSLELPSLLDRYIEKGMLHRTKSEEREGLFYLETEVFTKDELVEYILDVLISPLNLEGFFEKHSGRRKIFPFPALSLILTINYVIYQYKNKALLKDEKIVCYLEWGAFGACGYPPRLKGYTAEKFKKIRKIWRLCLDFNPELKPMFYVLLPSGIFNLLPHGFYEEDGLIMENFFTKYLKFTEENKDLSFDVLVQRLEDFASKNILVSKFSEYFQSRFKGNRFFYHQENIDKMEGDININPDFLKCSASSLCILVGWFFEGKHLL